MEEDEIFMKNVQQVIEKNISNPNLKGAFIAQKLEISRMQLHRKLKLITNQNARAYITNIRIAQAQKELENTSKFTHQIAQEHGFKHYTYFSKVFKKHIGCSPSRYRKNMMEE